MTKCLSKSPLLGLYLGLRSRSRNTEHCDGSSNIKLVLRQAAGAGWQRWNSKRNFRPSVRPEHSRVRTAQSVPLGLPPYVEGLNVTFKFSLTTCQATSYCIRRAADTGWRVRPQRVTLGLTFTQTSYELENTGGFTDERFFTSAKSAEL